MHVRVFYCVDVGLCVCACACVFACVCMHVCAKAREKETQVAPKLVTFRVSREKT